MPAPRRIQRYGWKPSLPDIRDVRADASGIALKPTVDPRRRMMKPYDQGQLGSCTANAVAAAIEYDSIVSGHHLPTPSRLDIYFGERVIEGSPTDQDTGAYGRDGFKHAKSTGWIPEKDWPYVVGKFDDQPPADAAHRTKIGAYKRVPRRVNDFKAVLSNDQTIAVGFTVYESFESQWSHNGFMPVPERGEATLGGHEVLVVGYAKTHPNYAMCRNSWGGGWALGGYFYMPWSVLMDADMSDDFWTIYRPLGG